MKLLPIVLALTVAASLTACSSNSDAPVVGSSSVGVHRVFDGADFDLYCDGEVAIFENYAGSKSSKGTWAGSDEACTGAPTSIPSNGDRKVVKFISGKNSIAFTLFCENGTAIYEYNGYHFGVSKDSRCAR